MQTKTLIYKYHANQTRHNKMEVVISEKKVEVISGRLVKSIQMARTRAAYHARGLNWPPPTLCVPISSKMRRVCPIQKNCVSQTTDVALKGFAGFQL